MDNQEDLRKLTFELILKSDPHNGIKDGENVQVFKIYGEEDTVENLKNRLSFSPRNWQSPTHYIGCNDRCDTVIRFFDDGPIKAISVAHYHRQGFQHGVTVYTK